MTPKTPGSPLRSSRSMAWPGGDEPLSPGSPMSVTSDGSVSSEESYHAPDETPDSRAKQVKGMAGGSREVKTNEVYLFIKKRRSCIRMRVCMCASLP
jgi:hypothetical protein